MHPTDEELRKAVALFRYGLIADVLRVPLGSREIRRALHEKAQRTYLIPGTRRSRVAVETMRDWLKLYRTGGFEALYPKTRVASLRLVIGKRGIGDRHHTGIGDRNHWNAHTEQLSQQHDGLLPQRASPPLVAFAVKMNTTSVQLEVAEPQVRDLLNPSAGVVEEQQQRPVAKRQGAGGGQPRTGVRRVVQSPQPEMSAVASGGTQAWCVCLL